MFRYSLMLLGLFTLTLYSQDHAIDSLIQELKKNLNTEKKVELNKEIGRIYLEGQVYMDSSIYYLHKAEQIAKNKNLESKALAETLFRLGHAYGIAEKWEKSLLYFKESATYSKKLKLDNGLISAGQNIAKIYMETKQYDLAKNAFLDGVALAQRLDKTNFILSGYTSLAEVYLLENNLNKAAEYIDKATEIVEEHNLSGHYYHYTRASILYTQKDIENAERDALLAEKMAKEENDLEYTYKSSALLSKIFEKQGDYDQSLHYLKQSVVYNDSIHNSHRLSEVDKMELQLQIQEQQANLTALKQKNKYLTTIYVLTILGILLLIILILRQLKIVRMTKNIHEIQNSLVKYEMEQRQMNVNTFQATQKGDEEFLNEKPTN